MAPYFASAFGTFLMRQTFLAVAARLRGGRRHRRRAVVGDRLVRAAADGQARPDRLLAIVSVTAHWNEFLWPLMVINEPRNQTLTIGLAAFARGAEGGKEWGVLAAGTLLVMCAAGGRRSSPSSAASSTVSCSVEPERLGGPINDN